MPQPALSPADREKAALAARLTVRSAALAHARATGAPIINRPVTPGSALTTRDVEPLTGAQAARQLELASRHAAHTYIRQAREACHTWHDIGTALRLTPGHDAQQAGSTPAEAAFTYAANPDTDYARTYGPSITWTCTACTKTITDRGPDNHPADNEHGHKPGCHRLQATITTWNAEWETEPATPEEPELEAGA